MCIISASTNPCSVFKFPFFPSENPDTNNLNDTPDIGSTLLHILKVALKLFYSYHWAKQT